MRQQRERRSQRRVHAVADDVARYDARKVRRQLVALHRRAFVCNDKPSPTEDTSIYVHSR